MWFVGGGARVVLHAITASHLLIGIDVFLSLSSGSDTTVSHEIIGRVQARRNLLAHVNKTSTTAEIKAWKTKRGEVCFKDDKQINSKTVRMAYIFRNP